MSSQPVRFKIGQGVLGLGQGDITSWPAQAVVNAANSHLAGGGGVDGAIHAAAGPELPKACREIIARIGRVEPGQAVITPGFKLAAGYIIHAVGPIWRGGTGGEPKQLASAYRSCLELCQEHEIASVAFPAISCGAYGYPVALAAPMALDELCRGLMENLVREAWMVLYSPAAFQEWLGLARQSLKES
jgi:O-acetyl-ADP-ribose deacetylase (regulator of RNase III)